MAASRRPVALDTDKACRSYPHRVLVQPLVPALAYALQRWAGQSSFQWKSRWGNIRLWAREGGWFIALFVALGVLADAQIWFFPALVTLVQNAWHDHLPGELGLLPSPLQYNNLFARLALLWPLAPTLALLYERIDPRTQVDPPRILLPRDLVKPHPAAPPEKLQASPEPEKEEKDQHTDQPEPVASTPPPKTSPKRPKKAQAKQQQSTQEPQAKPAQQTPRPTGPHPSGTAHKKKKQGRDQAHASTEPVAESAPAKPPETINWDDVAE